MNFQVVILAAGRGTRMGSDRAKVLVPIDGKPILAHLVGSVAAAGLGTEPVVVVSPDGGNGVCEAFGATCRYAVQEVPLGTGHALACAREAVHDADAVIVLYGDHPLVTPEALRRLATIHEREGSCVTIMTTTVPSFDGWHSTFLHWGRILRGPEGEVVGIREFKDATESEREMHEVNPGLYCFDAAWLWGNIDLISNQNASGEYYLTDLVELAVAQGRPISGSEIRPEESVGVNTPEERALAERLVRGESV